MTLPATSYLAALEFTSFSMLGWLSAATLPWLIHRLTRRRHQTTTWAAVELLLSAMQQRGRRVQLQQWLLIAVRTAILLCLAVAAAEPILRDWEVGAGGAANRHRIIVVDQSYSMGCRQQGTSRWQRAKAHAREWIDNSSGGDALTVIGWSKQAENLTGRATLDPSIALAALEDLRLTQTSGQLAVASRAVLAAIDRAIIEMPNRRAQQVVFCTDLDRQTWSPDDQQRQLLETIAQRAKVTVVNVADDCRDNIAVANLTIEPAITMQQREATITTTLTCFGRAPPAGVRVEIKVEGRLVHQQQLDLQSYGETVMRFTHRFVDASAQTVQASVVDQNDGMAIDDQRWLIVDVRPTLRVACFAGQPGATDDLARALAPGGPGTDHDQIVQPEVLPLGRLAELKLSNYAAVLLGSVGELAPRESAALMEYVRQGGGLAIFLGQDSSAARLGAAAQLLPVQIERLQTGGEYRLDPQEYRHPIVAPFRGRVQSGLLTVAVSQYFRLLPRNDRGGAESVLKFNTGDPALVVDRFGLGQVAVSALPGSLQARTPSGTPWSSFALSPSFLPVIRELVAYLVGDRWSQQRNLLVGEPAIFAWPSGEQKATVGLPGGAEQTLPLPVAEDRGQLEFRDTNRQGVYRFRGDEQEIARFAINLDGRDSDLMPIDLATLPSGFSATTVESSGGSPTGGGELSLARTMLAAALLLLLSETGLACNLGRGWG